MKFIRTSTVSLFAVKFCLIIRTFTVSLFVVKFCLIIRTSTFSLFVVKFCLVIILRYSKNQQWRHSNRNTSEEHQTLWKLTTMTREQCQWSLSDVFTVNSKQFWIVVFEPFSLPGSANGCGLLFGQVQWRNDSADSIHNHCHFRFLKEASLLFSRKQYFIKPWWNSWKTSEKGRSLHINLQWVFS